MSSTSLALRSTLVVVAFASAVLGQPIAEPQWMNGGGTPMASEAGAACDGCCEAAGGPCAAGACSDSVGGASYCPPVGGCCHLCGTPADFCDAFTNQGPCDPSGCRSYCQSSCDMPQHMAYYPESHGYYYFQPYNYQHLPAHQQFVASFGGDIRNPYDVSILDDLAAGGPAEASMPQDNWRPAANPFLNDARNAEELAPGQARDEPMEIER